MTNHSGGGTPRTDKLKIPSEALLLIGQKGVPEQIVKAILMLGDHARTLERELAAAQSALAEKERELEHDRERWNEAVYDAAHCDAKLQEAERILRLISGIVVSENGKYIVTAGPVMQRIALNYFEHPTHITTSKCGFDRDGSRNADHYVCMCGWEDIAPPASPAGRKE